MSKVADHNSMDAALNDVKSNGNILHICSAQPANYAGIAAVTLGNVALASGDYTLQDGAVSGRRVTVAQKTVTGTGGGTAGFIVIADTANTRIKTVTTCPSYTMANGVPVVVASFDAWEIEDPT
jgi:hypothetical protein